MGSNSGSPTTKLREGPGKDSFKVILGPGKHGMQLLSSIGHHRCQIQSWSSCLGCQWNHMFNCNLYCRPNTLLCLYTMLHSLLEGLHSPLSKLWPSPRKIHCNQESILI